ncbi:unnamed protein product [Microthlaspi erraticum]|uniref:FAS1 domain-containing protein n=1 Tax=Microthlaspi erraticum TaxID=1685480 RepID=A0A6D2K765_9BRAS|nr:unnamed protein product [Microthlaspi erraticum]
MSCRLLILISAVAVFAVVSGTVEETARDIIDALTHAPFEEWSGVFIATNDRIRIKVIRSTFFVPNSSANGYGGNDRQKVAAYHIVSERLEFADLLSKASQSRLPTLLTGSSILVTNNSGSGFTVDGVLITEPDMFVDSFMAIHGIAVPLDFKTYGSERRL